METFLNNLYTSSSFPVWSAFLLGLIAAIGPCALTTNITAIGYISKDLQIKRQVFLNGIYYTLGRVFTYSIIGLLFYFGASQFHISRFLQQWGELILGPVLIFVGLIMLDLFSIPFPQLSSLKRRLELKSNFGFWSSFLMGVLFALAFCPYNGVLYFGLLIPMTLSSVSGLFLPAVYALATGLPVILFAWFIAFSFNRMGRAFNKIKLFEKWFRKIVAIFFIGVGLYLILISV